MFRVGDRVRIIESSEFYTERDPENPKNIYGTIVKIGHWDLGIDVIWDNDTHNSYNDYDLITLSEYRKLKLKRILRVS